MATHSYLGTAFWLITQPLFSVFKNKDILVIRTSSAESRAPIRLVLTFFVILNIFWPELVVVTLPPPFGTSSSEHPQKFFHRSLFFGQLLFRNRVAKNLGRTPLKEQISVCVCLIVQIRLIIQLSTLKIVGYHKLLHS